MVLVLSFKCLNGFVLFVCFGLGCEGLIYVVFNVYVCVAST